MIKVGLVSLIYFHFLDVFNECHPNIGQKVKTIHQDTVKSTSPFLPVSRLTTPCRFSRNVKFDSKQSPIVLSLSSLASFSRSQVSGRPPSIPLTYIISKNNSIFMYISFRPSRPICHYICNNVLPLNTIVMSSVIHHNCLLVL